MNKDEPSFDDLDRRIIAELRRDGRASYKDIAKKLNVSDGTIRFRVNRMNRDGLVRISALINPFRFQNALMALIGMRLEKRTQKETMEKLSRLDGVLNVCNVTGAYDLFVEVFMESRQDLNKFLFEDLSRIDGIRTTETFVYLDARKKWADVSWERSVPDGPR